MPINFRLDQRLAGFAAAAAQEGQQAQVIFRELVAPADSEHLIDRLERMHGALFSKIPDLPKPSTIDHLLVIIRPDLSATAYVNELRMTAVIQPGRPVAAGEPVYASDVAHIESLDLGIEIPDDAAVVLVRSTNWRRSLFYDLGPIHEPPIRRDYQLSEVLAQQALLLLGILGPEVGAGGAEEQTTVVRAGLAELEALLNGRSEDEARYQEVFERNPWMFGGMYAEIVRHQNLDDERIPDFTGLRSYDHAHDIIEIKQPFLQVVRRDDEFTAPFNAAWNQTERYLAFCQRQRQYLRDEKGLHFENPRALLILGFGLSDEQRRAIREKEMFAPAISVRTYDELLRMARYLVHMVETAGQRVAEGVRFPA